jgi:hypothetical protein
MIAVVARGIAGDHANSCNQTRNRNRSRLESAAVDDGTRCAQTLKKNPRNRQKSQCSQWLIPVPAPGNDPIGATFPPRRVS